MQRAISSPLLDDLSISGATSVLLNFTGSSSLTLYEVSEAAQMVAKVRDNGGPVWFLEARDEGHGFRKKPNMDFQFYATVLFMQQTLLKPQN